MSIEVETITVHESDTPLLRFQLVRKRAGVVIDSIGYDDLTSLTLTHKNASDGTIINSRNGQNILNANNVTVDADGWVEWKMQAADNAILSTSLKSGEFEDHISKFTIKAKSGLSSIRYVRTRVMKGL